jgi:truncated hemoglobin YjbI
VTYPKFPTQNGYLTQITREKYIASAIERQLLPTDAHKISEIVSLTAPRDAHAPIQFWQLYSVLGQDPIVDIVADFYQRVFAQDAWFRDVFAQVGGLNHHIGTQASMWVDVMGGGPYYHGAEFRLSFHHTHNAHTLMNEVGAKLWVQLMVQALDTCDVQRGGDPRVRRSLNTFLAHFFDKYARDFSFENRETFGATNIAYPGR